MRALRRETLQSLAVGLGQTEAMVVGRTTGGFPLVVDVDALPEGFPPAGVTRSFWTRRRDGRMRGLRDLQNMMDTEGGHRGRAHSQPRRVPPSRAA